MATLPSAFICPQGNIRSRKLNDPSGFVVQAPSGTKTFRDLEASVKWCLKRGYTPKLSKPVKETGETLWLDQQFNMAGVAAAAALAAEQAKLAALRAAEQ